MKTVKEMIAVMQAYLDGRKIEVKLKFNNDSFWEEVGNPLWDWDGCDYRIKPEDVKVYLYRSRITGSLIPSLHLIPEDQDVLVGQGIITAEGWSQPPKKRIQ